MSEHQSKFLGSAKLVALCTLLSRITGLARDMVMNFAYGQGWVQDAFNYGFQVPNLFRRLFGEGALAAVFIPVFTDVLEKKGKERGWELLGRVAGLMTLVLTVLLVVLEGIVLVVYQFSDGAALTNLQIGLTAVMLPFMVGVCIVALFSSILNVMHHFTVPALMPIVLNVVNIIGVTTVGPLFFGPKIENQVYGVAICVLASSLIQLPFLIPTMRKYGVKLRLSLQYRDEDFRAIIRGFLPILLGQGILLFNVFFDAQLCTYMTRGPGMPETFTLWGMTLRYPLEQGALSAVTNAQRLYQFPLGVLAISLATAAFPMFSRFASREDMSGLRGAFAQAMRMAIFVGMPSGLLMVVLREPIVTLLFEHGRFNHAATVRAAEVLYWYGLGMAAFCCQHILLRGFWSLKDTLTPMWISCGLVVVNATMNVALLWWAGEAAFGISTMVTSFMHVVISSQLLRRRMGGRIGATELMVSALKTLAATIAAGAAAYFAMEGLMKTGVIDMSRYLRDPALVFGPAAAAGIVFLVGSKLLKMDELGWVLARGTKAGASISGFPVEAVGAANVQEAGASALVDPTTAIPTATDQPSDDSVRKKK
ncbi:MAG: murein biosynthesis integral membrane protein MurJ [Planctomycetes bacterium]|nr:murein biosynthesis integral membrane protein MurJ [Planctomycetota bacterium]